MLELNVRQIALRSALATALFLFGGLLLGFVAASGFSQLPMHVPDSIQMLVSMAIILSILLAAGAAWGRAMARLSRAGEPRRMAKAGALSFGPALVLSALVLSSLEVAIIERGDGTSLPIHVVFTLLFVPAVFVVAGAGGLALGIAQGDWRFAWRCALSSGLAGSAAFLLVNLGMDQLGWRVGAPGAAERATMLTVMMAGSLGAALAGGGAIGGTLGKNALRDASRPLDVDQYTLQDVK